MEYKVRFERLMVACCASVLCIAIHSWIGWNMHSSLMQGAQYRAAVAMLPVQFGGSMSDGQLARFIQTLESLQLGGVQPLLGLDFDADPLNDVIDDSAFDLQATITLIRKRQVLPAKADLELLATMVDGAQQRKRSLYKIFFIASLALTISILSYLAYAVFCLYRREFEKPTFVSEQDRKPLIPKNFNDYLKAVVNEEVSLTGNKACLTIGGIKTSELPAALAMVVEQLVEQLVRNSIEHGGRPAEQRVAAGKIERLRVKVQINELDTGYVVVVRDDGEGIDYDGVVKRALQLDLIRGKTAANLSAEHANQLIFLPGFHCPDRQVSQADNDQNLTELRMLASTLKGEFSVRSKSGQFCQFSIMFPKDALPSESVRI